MATRAKAALVGFLCILGAVAVAPSAGASAAGRDPEITVTVLGPPGSFAADLSGRGHVAYAMSGTQFGDDSGVYRWYQGNAVRLTPTFDPSTSTAHPTAVNDRGAVVGWTYDVHASGPWGFQWRDGVYTPAPARPGYSSMEDINEFGAVLLNRDEEGTSISTIWRAAVLVGDHEFTSPLIPGRRPLDGLAINNWGTVIGDAIDEEFHDVAFRWQPGTDPMPLLPEGTVQSRTWEINDRGTVLGVALGPEPGPTRPFLWRHGRFTDVGVLVPWERDFFRRSDRLNGRDQVVGLVDLDNGEQHAALWSRGRTIDLGTLGGTYSEALGINDRGEVVGYSARADGTRTAFLWRDGTMTDLGALTDAPTSTAFAINNRGQILGHLGDGPTTQPVFWETRPQR
jgi:probable HAF family extracellular repeat protein